MSGGCAGWEECHEKASGEALSSRTQRLGPGLLNLLRDSESVFSNNFIQSNFSLQALLYFVDIVTSRRGECLERLGTRLKWTGARTT